MSNNYLRKNNIRDLRLKARLSQKEVANFLGLTSTDLVSRWEDDISDPSFSTMSDLARLFRVPMRYLFTKSEKETD